MKRCIVSFFILIIFIQVFVPFSESDSTRYQYDGNIEYNGYKEKIDLIKANHPNWNFIIMKTGLDWNEVIQNEYAGHHTSPKNLIQGKNGGWICSICGEQLYDTGMWMCASEQAIRYYMDPRNFLIDSPYLFQFLKLDYDSTSDEEIYNSLNGTFLYSMENAIIINNVCRDNNANPYFIISRIIQEQGNAGGATYKMMDSNGTIYYNLFNIGATGNGNEVYENALKKAKEMNWTSIEKSIRGGISFIVSSYINYKQNTLYLNKFDVESFGGLYWKQYMQNIEAPKTEAVSMYNKMKKANLLDRNLTFIIPVYENMPNISSYSPDKIGELYPKNLKVKEGHSRIVIRAGASTSTLVVGYINDSNTNILSVERFSDGWHKILLEDGTQGFIKFNSDYLEEIDDIVNCNEKMIITQNCSIRVGPGMNQTEITFVKKGEQINRIDNSGRYIFNGHIWDRVKLLDGRSGFVMRDYLEEENKEIIINNNMEEDDLNQIENNNSYNTEINENISMDENLNNNINQSNDEYNNTFEIMEENIIENEDNNFEIENEIVVENVEEDDTEEYYYISPEKNSIDLDGRIIKGDTETVEAGTGYILEKNNKKYIIVKKGDVNGDSYVKANDYLIIKDYIMKQKNIDLKNEFLQAADVTNDKKVKANDYLKIKDHIMYGISI